MREWCQTQQIECVESIGHTLWNPLEVIERNGGMSLTIRKQRHYLYCFNFNVLFPFFNVGKPPVTFQMFNHVVSAIGVPPRPLPGKK